MCKQIYKIYVRLYISYIYNIAIKIVLYNVVIIMYSSIEYGNY